MDKELEKYHFGQFLFLYFLGKNIDYTTFRAILKAIAPESNEVVEGNEGIFFSVLLFFFCYFYFIVLVNIFLILTFFPISFFF